MEIDDAGLITNYMMICKLVSFNSPTGNIASNNYPFTINLKAEFPFIQSYTEYSKQLEESFITPGDAIPDILPDRIGRISAGANILINNGTIPSYPRIIVSGLTTDFVRISNATNGQTMTLNVVLTGSDDLTIDTWRQTIYKNSTINYISIKDGDWIQLEPGNNILLYAFSVGTLATTTVFWRDNYLGK